MSNNINENENTQTEAEQSGKSSSAGGRVRQILNIVLDVILYLFLALCLFMLIVSVVSKKDADGAISIFGHEMRIVVSSSMEKSENSVDVSQYKIKDLKLRSMVFVEKVPEDEAKAQEWYSKLEVGDVLTFRYVIGSSQQTITHRITEITPTDSGYIILLQGDNRGEGATVSTQRIYTSSKDYPSDSEYYNYVIGKVTGSSTFLGYMAYSIKQPIGTALIIIVPCSIIIIWQVVRIVLVVNEDRKKKAAAEIEKANQKAAEEAEQREKQAAELEEMRRRLAELENKRANTDGAENESK